MKLQLMLAVRGGQEKDLGEALEAEARRCLARLRGSGSVIALRRIAQDPFAAVQPPMRAFDAVLELRRDGADAAGALLDAAAGVGERLADTIHADLSGALAGELHTIVPVQGPPVPFRFLYPMRRKAGMSHEQYLAHYLGHHAEFGRRTPGIAGYDQFHLEPALSRAAAGAAAVGVWSADSVAELHLRSVEEFFEKAPGSEVGTGAIADEETFVDRRNSVAFCCEVVQRLGHATMGAPVPGGEGGGRP